MAAAPKPVRIGQCATADGLMVLSPATGGATQARGYGSFSDAATQTNVLSLVILASLANALNQADRAVMPIAVIPMAQEFGWGMLEQGWVLSSFAVGYIAAQLPSGCAATRLRPFGVLFGAVLAWSCCTMLTPWAARVGLRTLLACRVCMGVAEGFCLPAIFQFFALRVPAALRSRAFAVVIASGSLGQLLASLACPHMVPWSRMFSTFGSAGLGWCALSTGLAIQQWAAADREQDGDGLRREGDMRSGDLQKPAEEGEDAEVKLEDGCPVWRQLATSPAVLAICLAHFGQNWTNYMLATWLPTYLSQELGLPVRDLSVTALPYLVSALAGVGMGHLADGVLARRSCDLLTVRRAATAVGLLGPAACQMLFLTTRSPSAAIAIASLSYLFGSATSSGYIANHADITARHAGLTFGIANMVATIPGILAGPLTAALVGAADGAWWPVFMLASGIGVACSGAYLALAQAHRVL